MSGIFDAPPAPTEDPSIAAERRRQQQLAERDRVRSIQDNLRAETEVDLSTIFGLNSLNAGLSPRRASPVAGFAARPRRSLLGPS
jgi:hypothetical protein